MRSGVRVLDLPRILAGSYIFRRQGIQLLQQQDQVVMLYMQDKRELRDTCDSKQSKVDGGDKMNATFRPLLTGIAFLTATNCAVAQGDAKAGFGFASSVCAECHAVRAGESKSPHAQVPSFQTIANASGMTATELRVWFQTDHRSMPTVALRDEDSDNVIAYILSLKKRR